MRYQIKIKEKLNKNKCKEQIRELEKSNKGKG